MKLQIAVFWMWQCSRTPL